MPKKTRAEKVAAEERKKLRLLGKTLTISESGSPAQTPLKKAVEKQISESNSQKGLSEEEQLTALYFMKDFRKSFIIIFSVIALEIIMYYGTINNYFKF